MSEINSLNVVKKWLSRYGLNDTEILVYSTITRYPHSRAADIQRRTRLVRTTIYYSLAELKNIGLISENLQNNIKTYTANNPAALSTNITETITRQNEMLEQLGNIKQIFAAVAGRGKGDETSHVQRFEGEAAIKQAIEQAIKCDSKRWHVLASRDNFLSHTSRQYKNYYLSERKRRGIVAKTLWEPHATIKTPALRDIVFRNPRVLPESFRGNFDSLIIVYDDTTLFVQPYTQMTAHAIHDKATTNIIRLLFMSIWDRAQKI